jgi:dynein heavy chain
MHQDISQLTVKYRVEQRKYCYVTPTNFLELLSTVIRLYDQRKESLRKDISKYESGVLKIEQTEKEVAKMKEYLE